MQIKKLRFTVEIRVTDLEIGHELGQTLGDGEGQGGQACCSPWGHRVGDDWATEQRQAGS